MAADLIRKKIDTLYGEEPAYQAELAQTEHVAHLSKHQKFLHSLSQSGRPLGEIQTAWHNYYQALSDTDKHAVWKEFYASYGSTPAPEPAKVQHHPAAGQSSYAAAVLPHVPHPRRVTESRNVSEIKKHLLNNVSQHAKKRSHHTRSLIFGFGMGTIVVLVLLFGFFNERFIAPFITPSRAVSSTPIVIDPNSVTDPSGEPRVIIPKINVEVPVVYDEKSIEEKAIQDALERGVVHYAASPSPGEQGNVAIVGHSSNNILNQGKYKFAFVLLNRLEIGDTFMLTKDGKRYVYRIYDKRVVKPTDISVLGPASKAASATLVTCDPPGTSLNRLIVVGEQITPDPSANVASKVETTQAQASIVPGNAPSLWQRLKKWLTS